MAFPIWMPVLALLVLSDGAPKPAGMRWAQAGPFPFPRPDETAKGEAAPTEAGAYLHDSVAQNAVRWTRAADGRRTILTAFGRGGDLLAVMRLEPDGRNLVLVDQMVVTYPRPDTIEVRRFVSPEEALARDPNRRNAQSPTNDALDRMTRYSFQRVQTGSLVRNVSSYDSRGRLVDFIDLTRDGTGRIVFSKTRIAFQALPADPADRLAAYRRAFDLWDRFGGLE